METVNSLTEILTAILGGKVKMENGVCTVYIERHDLKTAIANVPMHNQSHVFSFEAPDYSGVSLITGELVLLEHEVPAVSGALSDNGIIITSVGSRWLYDKPKLIYVNVEDIAPPERFARAVSQIIIR